VKIQSTNKDKANQIARAAADGHCCVHCTGILIDQSELNMNCKKM